MWQELSRGSVERASLTSELSGFWPREIAIEQCPLPPLVLLVQKASVELPQGWQRVCAVEKADSRRVEILPGFPPDLECPPRMKACSNTARQVVQCLVSVLLQMSCPDRVSGPEPCKEEKDNAKLGCGGVCLPF
jgi:hypothetical protein